jgi:F0F1-type ATP synthase membrane subunit c/vacuolar-type H+-ATPase subunit K
MPIEVGTQGNRIQVIDDLGNLTPVAITGTGLLTGSDIALSGAGMGKLMHSQSGTVARTDTAAKNLFTLPANAVIVAIRLYGAVASDAVTTATVSVGKSGSATAYLNAADVKGGGVGVLSTGAKATLGSIGSSAVVVQGIYAETGGASSTGGPWTCFIDYTT